MSKIKTILSIIFIFTIWGCVSLAYPILLWWSRECVLYLIIIIKPEVWIINHCLGLGHETMVCAVCLTMFLLIRCMMMLVLPEPVNKNMGQQMSGLSLMIVVTIIGNFMSITTEIPGLLCPWNFPLNIGLNMFHSDTLEAYLDSLLGYSIGEFQVLHLMSWINHPPPVCWSPFS